MNWTLAVILATLAGGGGPAKPPPLVSDAGIKAAQAFARQREGDVSFAVVGAKGRISGYDRTRTYPSASVAKAMLLVEILRRAGARELSAYEQSKLEPMITRSANQPARDLFATVGSPGLYEVAEAAKMRQFESSNSLFESRISAEDQARFFFHMDRLIPRRHRRYARHLLSGIIDAQRWGIAAVVAGRRKLTPFFKGGWRSDVVHQVARIERTRKQRVAVAVLSATTDQGYGRATVEGVARRVLRLDLPRDGGRRDRLARRRGAQ